MHKTLLTKELSQQQDSVLVYLQAKVVDPVTGETVPLGTAGELMIRGYCVMKGYWNDPVKTSETITDAHWYKTGCV